MMRCLHICNDFLGSQVHRNLYTGLDKLGVEQIIFVPYRKTQNINKNKIEFEQPESKVYFSEPLKRRHKVFFRSKIKFLIKSLDEQILIKNLDVIYATTLFSDGSIALHLHKTFGTPYIVAVRSTDVDVFMKFRPDLKTLAKEILINSQKIIFISDSLKEKFEKKIDIDFFREISSKINVIYNGVSSFWLSNIDITRKRIDRNINLVYVGSFIRRKNVLRVIKAVLELSSKYPIKFNIIGGKGVDLPRIKKYSKQFPENIQYLGSITDSHHLLQELRNNHIFIMPSFRETFGLVYIEALSQGLPLIYAHNEGVDGMLEGIGIAVNPYSVASIKNGIENCIFGYKNFRIEEINFTQFNWSNIAKCYFDMFESIKKDKNV